MTDENILNKVRALLNKAESTDFPEEAEAFSAKAEELMVRHAIDMAMLAETDPGKSDRIVSREVRIENPHLTIKGAFLYQLAKTLGVRGAYRCTKRLDKDGKTYYSIMGLVGYETDVDWVETLFTSLELQRINALTQGLRAKRSQEHGRTFTQSFNEAYRQTVVSRVKQTRATAVATTAPTTSGKSTALVLVAREEQVDAEYRRAFPNVRESHRRVRYNSASGYQSGQAAGSTANIARGSLSGAKRALR